uniref:Uncharacterized protein n=1 Tax=Panagrolaimus sp. ES5 TaxID=591445 RepID=A0AC34G1Q3_9BILA
MEKKLIVLPEKVLMLHNNDAIVEESKWILDNKNTNFHAFPLSTRRYDFGCYCGEHECLLWTTREYRTLPYESTRVFIKSCLTHFMGYMDIQTFDDVDLKKFKLNENAHEYEITLKIDINDHPSFEVHGRTVEQIVNMPKYCKKVLRGNSDDKKFPVIGFYDKYSFICVWNQVDKEYKFLESWGGQWGQPMCISFAKDKPEFGHVAEEILGKHGKFVVDDFMSFMCRAKKLPTDKPGTYFSITSDNDHSILIEFDNFDGTKKAATPEFLMALLLKEHIKAIKNEIGEKPSKINFCFLDKFNLQDRQQIAKCLKKSCKFLQMEEYAFFHNRDVYVNIRLPCWKKRWHFRRHKYFGQYKSRFFYMKT